MTEYKIPQKKKWLSAKNGDWVQKKVTEHKKKSDWNIFVVIDKRPKIQQQSRNKYKGEIITVFQISECFMSLEIHQQSKWEYQQYVSYTVLSYELKYSTLYAVNY